MQVINRIITPFSLSIDELTNLSPERAVEFFRRFLWAEGARVGVGKNLIDVPDCINVGDGGIDAYIEDAQPQNEEVIPQGTSGFQIKSSDLSPKQCKKELHIKEELFEPIKPEIEKILDEDGSYILVLFTKITVQKKKRRKENIIKELKEHSYPNPKVRIYTANQLVSFSESFPGLITWLKGSGLQCLPYSSWAGRGDVITPREFIYDSERRKYIEEIRERLRNPNTKCPIFRVIGLPGIGKTRLVFEALSSDDLKNRVIYVGAANQFQSSNLHFELQNNSNLYAILVIDECDLRQHEEFVRSFSNRGSRLSVITISHDMIKVSQPSTTYKLSPLGSDKIEEMLKAEFPKLPDEIISRLSKFADGYPRIAILLAKTYLTSNSSSEEFYTIRDDVLMNRLIGGGIFTSSEDFKKNKSVLTALSLFQKIGFEGELSREAKWLSGYFSIPWNDFKEVVEIQRQRGIIQGQYYIYITPFMLRINLLREWWDTQGLTKENFKEFVKSIPKEFRGDLLERFFDHIPYINTTKHGKDFAKAILNENGIFYDGSFLKTELGANFFLKLVEADQKSALKCLNRTVGIWSKDELLKFTTGRREIVWALEKLAMWKDLFSDSARLLLALGEAENETCSNNASGVFAGLFSPARGRVAPTEASPKERFPILTKALESSSNERRLLALNAFNQALELEHFIRFGAMEHQGLRKEPQLWIPKTRVELFNAYIRVWQFLYKKLDSLPEDEQKKAVDILLKRSGGLLRIYSYNLADMVIDTLNELVKKPYIDKRIILTEVIRILKYDYKNLPQQIRQGLEQIKDKLTGSDFTSLMKRYVGMDLWEDKFNEKGDIVDQTKLQIEKLAKQAVENKDLLQKELDWLVTADAQNGYRFGYELGKKDKGFLLLPALLEAQRGGGNNASAYFLSGYFQVLFEKDKKRWEKQLDALTKDKEMNLWIPELTWRSGISDQAALRILSLAEKGIIGIDHFGIFGMGGVIKELSEDVFKKWVKFLLSSSNNNAISIALDLYYFYYIHEDLKHTLPEELTVHLLTHYLLFQKPEEGKRRQMDEYHWTDIGKVFIQLYPERSLEIANKMLEHFGEDGTILEGFHSKTQSVLNEITQKYLKEMWKLITSYLGPPIDSRAFNIKGWLRGGEFYEAKEGALNFIPLEEIWEWVDEDVEKRAWYLAYFVPKKLFLEEGKICLAREVLIRYGDREDVRRNFYANYFTEGYWGSRSSYYMNKRKELTEFRKKETNTNVITWIDECIESINRNIKRAKIEEERGEF